MLVAQYNIACGLKKFTLQESGLKQLRRALCGDISVGFFNNSVVPFLARLGSDQLDRAACCEPLLVCMRAFFVYAYSVT